MDLHDEREAPVEGDAVAVVGGLETVAASEASVSTGGGNMLMGGGARGPLLGLIRAELLLLVVGGVLVMVGTAVVLVRLVSTSFSLPEEAFHALLSLLPALYWL